MTQIAEKSHSPTRGDYREHARELLTTFDESYVVVKGRRGSLFHLVEEGVPIRDLTWVSKRYHISKINITDFIGISISTLKRRYRSGRLNTAESDRFVRLMGLYAMAEDILGSAELASQWMLTPNRSLGGISPNDYARTDVGAREVEDMLGRIATGVAA